MHDRPSEKPPSVFTRHFNKHVSASVDELMDEYYKYNDKPLPRYPVSQALPHGLGPKSPERKRQPKDTQFHVAASMPLTDAEEAKSGGIFRFGKSMASAFNPLNVWSKFTTGWRATKEELVEDALDAQKTEMLERQKKAEQAYAELKQAGKLGTQGSQTMNGALVFTPGYTQPAKNASQRDSGISMDDGSRTSVDTSKSLHLSPPEESPKKPSRHGRTPSFHNLRKMASEFSLHRRSASGAMSPEKRDKNMEDERPGRMRRSKSRSDVSELFEADGTFSSLRGSKSRNDLFEGFNNVDEFGSVRSRKEMVKQVKLTKRVSDLEARLDSARRDLDRALGKAPPVPVLSPPSVDRRHLGRPEGRRSDDSRAFVPALPTLFSESLLVPPAYGLNTQHVNDRETVTTADALHSENKSIMPVDISIKEEPLHESNGNSLYMQLNQPLLKGEFENSLPAKENVPGTPGSEEHPLLALPQTPKLKNGKEASLVDPSSQHTEAPQMTVNMLTKKTPAKKKHLGKEDRLYRLGTEDLANDGAEWEKAKSKPAKKKRTSDEGMANSPKRSRASRLAVAADSPRAKGKKGVLIKPTPRPKELPPVPVPTEATAQPPTGLETVHEEFSFTNVIPVKGSPRKPTAKATPAFPHHHRRGTSSSPSRSPRRVRTVLTPKRGRDTRSPSPSPSSTLGKFMNKEDSIMIVRPNEGDVPEMPGRTLESKSSFEWPDDVF
jgi:hypothetical protein